VFITHSRTLSCVINHRGAPRLMATSPVLPHAPHTGGNTDLSLILPYLNRAHHGQE